MLVQTSLPSRFCLCMTSHWRIWQIFVILVLFTCRITVVDLTLPKEDILPTSIFFKHKLLAFYNIKLTVNHLIFEVDSSYQQNTLRKYTFLFSPNNKEKNVVLAYNSRASHLHFFLLFKLKIFCLASLILGAM